MVLDALPPSTKAMRDIYIKVDLHVHTPWSSCYCDHMMPEAGLSTSPEDIVATALRVGLQGIAITDHNTVEGIDAARKAALKYGLPFLPGIEFSARGGHVLALFERDTPVSEMQELVRSLGFTREQEGRGYIEGELWLDEVSRRIGEGGGLAIAAHIDRRPKGLIASNEALADKIRAYNSDSLSALEITIPGDRLKWRRGLMPDFPKGYPCIQSSDAHALDEIGRRPVYLKLPELTLEGLRLAFREDEDRVRFPEDSVGPR